MQSVFAVERRKIFEANEFHVLNWTIVRSQFELNHSYRFHSILIVYRFSVAAAAADSIEIFAHSLLKWLLNTPSICFIRAHYGTLKEHAIWNNALHSKLLIQDTSNPLHGYTLWTGTTETETVYCVVWSSKLQDINFILFSISIVIIDFSSNQQKKKIDEIPQTIIDSEFLVLHFFLLTPVIENFQ